MRSAIETLEGRLGVKWAAIRGARERTEEVLGKLRVELVDFDDPNYSVVVTGSLGRGEATEGSDADWILLVDGRSDPSHAMMAREIGGRIRRIVSREAGRTGTFGGIVASHELVHYIAGTRDTNENLTRRILLLSESRPLTNPFIRRRVIENVLLRYVVYDRSVMSRSGVRQTVPHFLLNDVVRYWRTMASDYASKMWERQREGWGIRNVKLRFSRKVLFIWGLLASFADELFSSAELYEVKNDDHYYKVLVEVIATLTEVSPLELLARVAQDCDDDEIVDAIFSSYDQFLSALSDRSARKKLEEVPFDAALNEPVYVRVRDASERFRDAIVGLFFDRHPRLPALMRRFGVF